MQAQLPQQSLTANIEFVVERILSERKITRVDQQCLMSVLLAKNALSLEDQNCINRVFDALRQGLVRVVD